VHVVAVDEEIGRGFARNCREDSMSVFIPKTLAVEMKVKIGSDSRPERKVEPGLFVVTVVEAAH
jgi:hypothetical protein